MCIRDSPGWRQEECLSAAEAFYPETERALGGSWWQKTPIFRELETEDQLEVWPERQTAPESCAYAGPLFPCLLYTSYFLCPGR